jgi:cyclic pyranopterin phosphate synthase
MIDVTPKPETARRAVAEGWLGLHPEVLRALQEQRAGKKGDVLRVAELAAIAAAKRTPDLIPLCHPLRLGKVEARAELVGERIRLRVSVAGIERTGFEMEALTAVSVGLLTAYDMLKYLKKEMSIEAIRLIEKSGGRSGDYRWRES